MSKVAFLILNYKNVGETEKCVCSIKKLSGESNVIVIVDNGSCDGSVERMHELYDDDDSIVVLESLQNVGFSKGNNLGYKYIRDNLLVDFIVVTNNDVLFPQLDFVSRLEEIFMQTGFHLLGPDIYVRQNGDHQSPLMLQLPTEKQILSDLRMYEHYMKNPKKWVCRRFFQNLKNRICQSNQLVNLIYSKLKGGDFIDKTSICFDCCLQGACIIVSKKYIENEEKMFDPEPFLYCEEIFLYKKCKEKKYVTVYNPSLQIWHEDSSTMKIINRNPLEKAKFTLPHHVAARKMLLECWNRKINKGPLE